MAGGESAQLIAALLPALILIGLIAAIFFIGGQRAARQQRLLERLLEESQRQTALLKRIDARQTGSPPEA